MRLRNFSVVSGDMAQPPSSSPQRNLLVRLVSAAILGPVVLAAVWAGPIYFAAVVIIFAAILILEWQRLCFSGRFHWVGMLMLIAVLSPIAATLLERFEWALGALVIGIISVEIVARINGQLSPWWLGFGCVYAALPCVALVWIHSEGTSGTALTFWLLAVVWATDSGAYAAGRLFGGPKLAPKISPQKTWSGGIGGLCAALIVGAVSFNLMAAPQIIGLLIVSAFVSVATQMGDLFESGIKRYFGVKDSGRIIPGHGGALDRLDGLLIAAPVAAGFMLLQQFGFWTWT